MQRKKIECKKFAILKTRGFKIWIWMDSKQTKKLLAHARHVENSEIEWSAYPFSYITYLYRRFTINSDNEITSTKTCSQTFRNNYSFSNLFATKLHPVSCCLHNLNLLQPFPFPFLFWIAFQWWNGVVLISSRCQSCLASTAMANRIITLYSSTKFAPYLLRSLIMVWVKPWTVCRHLLFLRRFVSS